MRKFVVFVWFLVCMVIWNLCGALISAKNDISLFVGIFILVGFIALSYYTKCFTKFFKQK